MAKADLVSCNEGNPRSKQTMVLSIMALTLKSCFPDLKVFNSVSVTSLGKVSIYKRVKIRCCQRLACTSNTYPVTIVTPKSERSITLPNSKSTHLPSALISNSHSKPPFAEGLLEKPGLKNI